MMNTKTGKITDEERLARIRLNAFAFLRTDWVARLMDLYGGALNILDRTAVEIARDGGISIETARRLMDDAGRIKPEEELNRVLKIGGSIMIPEDKEFPDALRDIPDAPLVLYVRGRIDPEQAAVAVVGTRRPTAYGRRMAFRLSSDLSRAGIAIASGLARGIDTVSHEAVIKAGKTTWAVLGTGLMRCYPAENRRLAEKIVDTGGALISEFTLDTSPLAMHFPRRNRIISGLSHATVVVEGDRRSGALITAKAALEQGREVLAVPGPADSAMSIGPNQLIRSGASLAETAQDVISCLPTRALFGVKLDDTAGTAASSAGGDSLKHKASGICPDSTAILQALGSEELCVDEIVIRLGWSAGAQGQGIPRAASALFELETRNLVTSFGGKYSKQ